MLWWRKCISETIGERLEREERRMMRERGRLGVRSGREGGTHALALQLQLPQAKVLAGRR